MLLLKLDSLSYNILLETTFFNDIFSQEKLNYKYFESLRLQK